MPALSKLAMLRLTFGVPFGSGKTSTFSVFGSKRTLVLGGVPHAAVGRGGDIVRVRAFGEEVFLIFRVGWRACW
jgi:hypothetical protein